MRPHVAGAQVRDVLAVEPDRAFGRLEQAQQHLADGRLAAAGFADEAQRLARIDREADAIDRLHHRDRAREQAALQRKVLLQVLDFDDRAHAAARSDASTRSASWQATTWPAPIGRNSGASVRQRATA